jgi:histidyl-tRNA synthetase
MAQNKGDSMNLRAPKGTRDVLPEEAAMRRKLESIFADICGRYGFGEIRTPTFEHTEVFVRGVGGSSDIVRKEMYTFLDKGDRSITLRPEGTAAVVRAFVEQGMASWPSPVKLWYNMNMFRYERMQKGRYREHNQIGCEIFGSESPMADAELIGLLDTFFRELGIKETELHINSIGCPICRVDYEKALRDYFRPYLDEMCDDCTERFEKNPLRMLDCKVIKCQEIAVEAPAPLDALCDDCRDHFDAVTSYLEALDIPYCVNLRLVRGLDYYTRTVFEFVSPNVGTQGSICGGGRYDGLIAELGGADIPGVGFALGIERLLLELEAQGVLPDTDNPPSLYIASFESTAAEALKLAQTLIRQGFSVATDVIGKSLRAQMKAADKLGVTYIVVLGDFELEQGIVNVRRLSDGEEQSCALTELGDFLESAVGAD